MISGTDNPATSNTDNIYQIGDVGIGTNKPKASFHIDAAKDNADTLTSEQIANDFIVTPIGNVGIGTITQDSSAILDITATNKGILTPSTYTANECYTGTMIVPYTGANGGVYSADTIGPIQGLTATLASGNFNVGSGNLAYSVTGIPTVTSPETTIFEINIGGKNCEAVIGNGDGIAPGDLIYYRTTLDASLSNVWLSDYASDLPIIGGKLRLDAWFNASSNQGNGAVTMYPRLVNTSADPVKFWFSALTTVDRFNASNYLIAAGGYVELDNGIYYDYGYNDILGTSTPRQSGSGQNAHQEVVTVDLTLDDRWYRIYYFPIVNNMNTVTNSDNVREIYLSIQRLY